MTAQIFRKRFVWLTFLCFQSIIVFSILLTYFSTAAEAVDPDDCPTFAFLDPPAGTDAMDQPIKAYFNPGDKDNPSDFLVGVFDGELDSPPSADDSRWTELEEESATPLVARWVADFGNIPAGNWFMYIYYKKFDAGFPGSYRLEECDHSQITVIRHGSIGEGSTSLTDKNEPFIKTPLGKISTEPGSLASTVVSLAIGVAGGVAFLMMVFGAYRLTLSGGNPEAVQQGREIITAAIVGLIVIIFSVFILRFIGISILGLE